MFQNLDLIVNTDRENTLRIDGPIQIAKNNFVSRLDYSDNFEFSFEFKASSIPGKDYYQILLGKLTLFAIIFNISRSIGTCVDLLEIS